MSIITNKINELKDLLRNKSLNEQKEIIIKFFYENRKISKHFKRFYKATKDIFKKSSLSDFLIQKFINDTFIIPKIMDFYSTYEFQIENTQNDSNCLIEEFDIWKIDPNEYKNLFNEKIENNKKEVK